MVDFIELTKKNSVTGENEKLSIKVDDISKFFPDSRGGTTIRYKGLSSFQDEVVLEAYEDIRDALGVLRIGNKREVA